MILVLGDGHVGNWLVKYNPYLYKMCTLRMEELTDLILKDEFYRDMDNCRICAVLNTAAKTDMIWCEKNPYECFKNNFEYPVALAKAIQSRLPKTTFIQISSGCVWQGPYKPDNTPFGPNDQVNPACIYTQCKALCDSVLLQEIDNIKILRPRLVYSDVNSPRNLLYKLNSYAKLIDSPNSITSVRTIHTTLHYLTFNTHACNSKMLNVYDRGVVSPLQIGYMLAARGLRNPPELLTKDSLDSWHKPKRVDVVLHDVTFEQLIQPPTVYEELDYMIGSFKNGIKA